MASGIRLQSFLDIAVGLWVILDMAVRLSGYGFGALWIWDFWMTVTFLWIWVCFFFVCWALPPFEDDLWEF